VRRDLEVDGVKPHRWFLPETPDVLGMLRDQLSVTVEGLEALKGWAEGDPAMGDVLRKQEHRADDHKRELQVALTTAFTTPIEPEDLFALSRGLDAILNGAKDAVREAEVMALAPDEPIATMAGLLLEGVQHLGVAFERLGEHGSNDATRAADEAVRTQRKMERTYRAAMGSLLEVDDLREVTARRELYRRFSRLGDGVVDVAERVWYAVVKEA
jgi:uncharacterized protein Yka (UPF0111/DUF47 family)